MSRLSSDPKDNKSLDSSIMAPQISFRAPKSQTVCKSHENENQKDERECKSLSTVTFLLIQNHERIEIRKIEIVNRLCPFSSWLNVNMSSQILSLSSFVSVYIFFALVRMQARNAYGFGCEMKFIKKKICPDKRQCGLQDKNYSIRTSIIVSHLGSQAKQKKRQPGILETMIKRFTEISDKE